MKREDLNDMLWFLAVAEERSDGTDTDERPDEDEKDDAGNIGKAFVASHVAWIKEK